ncbi:DUF2975 domain-containing protein [uncultured Chryseobacterium sp.]|uniref:DUF2975 domain-containing protein n=1 Tax=uncultured Chryseobacterium sp. TaxID=259322 RepID=UPI0025F4BE13|nr:DUF2975 domain-containing protein [uncultured Chryseobacterium sp.]
MKIIGKNSFSQYAAIILRLLCIFFMIELIYISIGFIISWYNYKTGNTILSDFFIVGKDVGWNKNLCTPSVVESLLKFRFFIPFTSHNLLTGIFNISSILTNLLGNLFAVLFFYVSYKFFREISRENVFSIYSLLWLKRFGWLNIIFTVLMSGIAIMFYNPMFLLNYSSISFLFFGALILFLVEFFKKGLELQNQADLTI